MTKCNTHKIIFLENLKNVSDVSSEFGEIYQINAECPVCRYTLNDDEIRDTLLSLYSKEIADLVYSAFNNKRAYLKDVASLTEKGISINFAPKIENQ